MRRVIDRAMEAIATPVHCLAMVVDGEARLRGLITGRRINLGYLDPASIRLADYRDKEEERILFVDHAGETLYRLEGEA